MADFALFVPRTFRYCRVEDMVDDVVEAGAAGGAPLVLRLAGGDGGIVVIRLIQNPRIFQKSFLGWIQL